MDRTKCPICNKAGIPDFMNEDVVCPCCNSNLSIYRKIHLSATNRSVGSNNKWSLIAAIFIAVLCCVIAYWEYDSHSHTQEQLASIKGQMAQKDARVIQLTDSIEVLSNLVEHNQDTLKDPLWHVVKPGDSFCKISQMVYGTERQYKTIIKLNGLSDDIILHPGDSIRIR